MFKGMVEGTQKRWRGCRGEEEEMWGKCRKESKDAGSGASGVQEKEEGGERKEEESM